MVVLNMKVDVPASRQLVIDLPPDTPVGPTELEVRLGEPFRDAVEIQIPDIDISNLPRYFDERSGEWRLVGRSGVVREVRSTE